MADSNGVGGSALYNMLIAANSKRFNADAFAVTKSSVINSSNNSATTPTTNLTDVGKTNAANAAAAAIAGGLGGISPALSQFSNQANNKIKAGNTKYEYDIFDRLSFGAAPNTPTSGIDATSVFSQVVPRNTNVDNRVVINYKNYVDFEKLNPTDKADQTFINKIKTDSRYSGKEFKDPSIETIVEQLSLHPTTKISYADFLYCKKLGSYPNNRLVILRRFFQPVDDNLFDSAFANNQQ